jgi:hypothetical protein
LRHWRSAGVEIRPVSGSAILEDMENPVRIDGSRDIPSDISELSILLHDPVHLRTGSGKFDAIANRCAKHSLKE